MEIYRPRIADVLLSGKLESMGAVLVEGPKWCGKTTTCKRLAKSVLDLSDPDVFVRAREMVGLSLKSLLDGPTPRLIDEWQDIPELWDAIRHRVDHVGGSGQFMLTGSAVVPEKKSERMRHTGTGRFARLKMRPMSLWESGESSGTLALSDLFAGKPFDAAGCRGLSLEEVAFIVCRGGWPGAIGKKSDTALGYAREYVESVAQSDLTRADGVPREPERIRRIMRSLARLQTTQSSIPAIRKDMAANDVSSLSETTIASYINALEKIFVVENAHAWSPSLRSKSSVRTSDTRYFVDPSLATAAIGVTPGNLMDDLRTLGLFFETMAVRDLRTYSGAMGGTISHYHDKTGLACDAVVHAPNGDYGLVEIKLGGEALIEQGTKSLGKLAALLRKKGGRQPLFIMIVTAVGDFAYRRKDGVLVCPLSALRP